MKRNYSIILIGLLIGIIHLFTSEIVRSQDWYDTAWHYRNSVIVSNPVGSLLTDFQVQISLDNSFDFSNAESDGNDVRITDIDGITLLPFWIEKWDEPGQLATIWTKLPEIPIAGTTIYLYYGNPEASTTLPDPIETPPIGPFTRDVNNPIAPIGDPGNGAGLLGENIVYDEVSGHYWMVFAIYRGGSYGVGLVWSDTPADATSWNWHGNVYTHPSGGSFAPHIIKEDGLWYIFFAKWPDIVYVASPTINGTYSSTTIALSPSETWEAYRVDEPYVFQRNDGKWIMIYMADAGSVTEQVGYASADDITGPYTKFAGNPCLAFGPPGSYDAGTIADPWVYEFDGTYYIGYTVSPTKNSPWQTALATTTDWLTFTKHGVIFPLAPSGWDAVNSFRGAVTRINDTYVFSYTGDSYRMGIATQPVYQAPENIINNGDAVFDFFDGFEGSEIDQSKWSFVNGELSQTNVDNGLLTLTSTSAVDYVKILGQDGFGMDYITETRAQHPNQGTLDMIAEVGFTDVSWNTVRIVDDFPSITHWQREAKLAGQPGNFVNMAQTADPNWHTFHLFRESPDLAGFQIDTNSVETINTDVPTMDLPPFLMSYGTNNQLIVDWTRVRKWAGEDPTTYVIPNSIELTAWESHSPILCFGDSSIVSIYATGGTPPYIGTGTFVQYAGTTIYQIEDALGDMVSVTVILSEPTELIGSHISTEILCYGENSIVTISASGGTEPYTGTGIFEYSAGTHIHNVTDANGCNSEVTIVLTETSALTVSATHTEIPYLGGSSTVTISATGGTPPYTGTGNFTQMSGTVVYTITDDNGCTADILVTISDPSTWYDLNWQYRRPVTVTNPGGITLMDFQVLVTLDNTFDFSKAEADGSEILVTDIDKTTLIPFWIETWDPVGQMADIWVKMPTIPIQGTTIYIYYGNADPIFPTPNPVETPPIGPFTRDIDNPIVPIGDPGAGAGLLAENIVYDEVTGHYWMVHAIYRGSSYGVGLVWSDTPTDATSWNWHGNVYTHTGSGSFAPHILKEDGTWYIFFAILPNIVYMTSPTIDGTYSSPTVVLTNTEPWEAFRVDEPYVFKRNDDKWILMYMGDYGSAHEQIGYATSDYITGPFVKHEGNPCLPFGPPGSYDAGTVADPWVYEFNSTYYIGYTVSPTTSSPWQTAVATTTDWLNFTKQGIIFPLASSGWDAVNCFRGAITRIGDTYVFAYTGDAYKMGVATQPVYMSPENLINNGDAVFDFFDDFEESAIDPSKWTFASGDISQTNIENGLLSLNATSTHIKINAQSTFGMNYMGETKAYHPNQGTQDMIAEVGFADNAWNAVRIVDDFLLGTTYWQRQAKTDGQPDEYFNMAQEADQDWHVFHVFRETPDIAGFQIDNQAVETTTGTANTSVPTSNIPPFLMSYGNGNQFVVDWTRVRKWIGQDPTTSIEAEEYMQILDLKVILEGAFSGVDMNTDLNDQGLLPLNQPYLSGPWFYTGTESAVEIPNSEIVDWLLVELRDATDAISAISVTTVARQAAFLLNNGNIVGIDGEALLQFDVPIEHQLYAVVWHRNHLSVMSANPLTRNPEGLYIYDFSYSSSQAHENGQLDLGGGIYGMYGGDLVPDGEINDLYDILFWILETGTSGYLNTDANLDGQINNQDKNDYWFKNLGSETKVP